jgi:hypothetical protein
MKQPKYLTELSCNTSVKVKFEALSRPELWIYIRREQLEISQLATEVLLIFGTTYLCEKYIFSNGKILNPNTLTAFNFKVTYGLLYRRFNRG